MFLQCVFYSALPELKYMNISVDLFLLEIPVGNGITSYVNPFPWT